VDRDECNFEIKHVRHWIVVQLVVHMLRKAYCDSGRLGACLGLREFGQEWLLNHFEPRDPFFEKSVLCAFLGESDG